MKVTLFGGSFDPPHLGHTQVANQLLKAKLTDQVWFVPCANHPFDKRLSPAQDRVEMLKLATNHKIYLFEINSINKSYTYSTLESSSKKYPKIEFSWIIGSDLLKDFNKWHKYQQILDNYPVFVYPRKGYSFKDLLPKMLPLTNFPTIDISSTQIRTTDCQNWNKIDSRVAKYITERNLYHEK